MNTKIRFRNWLQPGAAFKLFAWLAVTVFMLTSFNLPAQAAGTAQLYLSPTSRTVTTGSNVSFNIRFNSGSEPATAIEAHGTYDQTKLQFISISHSGSPFDFLVEQGGGSGSFHTVQAAFGANPTGDVLVATVTFKTLSAGQSSVNLTDQSEASDPDGQFFTLQRSGATATANDPTPDPDPDPDPDPTPDPDPDPDPTPDPGSGSGGGSSSGGSSGGSSSGGNQTSTSSRAGLNLAVTPDYVGYTLVRFNVQTNRNAAVSVKYGLAADNLEFTTKATKASTRHTVNLDTKVVEPGKAYFYQVTARDSAGVTVRSDVLSVETLGVPLALQVLDKDGSPVEGVSVTLKDNEDTAATTGVDGYAIFDSVPGGNQIFEVSAGWWQSSEHEVFVGPAGVKTTTAETESGVSLVQSAEQQNSVIQLDYKPISLGVGDILKGVGLLLLLGVAIIVILRLVNMLRSRINYARTIENQRDTTLVSPNSPPAAGPVYPSVQQPPYSTPTTPPVQQPPTTTPPAGPVPPQPPTPPPPTQSGSQEPGQVIQPTNNNER